MSRAFLPTIYAACLCGYLLLACYAGVAQTTVEKIGENWTLLVEGKPFSVKGATFGYDEKVGEYDRYLEELAFLGVNTIRTWGTNEHTGELLDAAENHGIKVMVGIWMRHGKPGREADDRFDYHSDSAGMEVMYEQAMETVSRYKNHPAVLLWGVGNEVYLNTKTAEEKVAYSRFLERVCSGIKSLDNQHPIASVEAWTFGLEWWQEYVPSLDIYGVNSYGPGAGILSGELTQRGIDMPYLLTEFGVMGEWDIEADRHGVTPEPSDAQKYETIVKGYREWIEPKPNCLGVYVFHYADADHFGAAWLHTHFQGMARPQYWAIRKAYTGEDPLNQVPVIESFSLPEAAHRSGTWLPVELRLSDPEGESLDVQFYYNQRTGSRKRRDQLNPLAVRGSLSDGFEVQLPPEDGGIKVYVVAEDDYHNAGIASTSITVRDREAAQREFLVPRVDLPFYVYQDGEELPYIPTAYMGNYEAIKVDMNHSEEVYEGESAIRVSYQAQSGWYGLGFVDPPGDWGDLLGGYDLSGAKTLRFWAKASYDGLNVKVGLGLLEDDRTYYDTDKKMVEITLTQEWQEYRIKLNRLDLSCIRTGLVFFASGEGISHHIYLDEVVYE